MNRSVWKTPFIDKSFLKLLDKPNKKPLVWSRRSTIYPAAVGMTLLIHNGKAMVECLVKPEMVGYKVGEFVPTRKPFVPKQKKGKKKKR